MWQSQTRPGILLPHPMTISHRWNPSFRGLLLKCHTRTRQTVFMTNAETELKWNTSSSSDVYCNQRTDLPVHAIKPKPQASILDCCYILYLYWLLLFYVMWKLLRGFGNSFPNVLRNLLISRNEVTDEKIWGYSNWWLICEFDATFLVVSWKYLCDYIRYDQHVGVSYRVERPSVEVKKGR